MEEKVKQQSSALLWLTGVRYFICLAMAVPVLLALTGCPATTHPAIAKPQWYASPNSNTDEIKLVTHLLDKDLARHCLNRIVDSRLPVDTHRLNPMSTMPKKYGSCFIKFEFNMRDSTVILTGQRKISNPSPDPFGGADDNWVPITYSTAGGCGGDSWYYMKTIAAKFEAIEILYNHPAD